MNDFQHVETPMRLTIDDDGEERLSIFHVDLDIPDFAVEAWVESNFPAERCKHDYDCCGRLYANKAHFWRVPYRDRVIVHQTFIRNI